MVELDPSAAAPLPAGAFAVPRRRQLEGGGAAAVALRAAVAEAPRLRPTERAAGEAPVGWLRIDQTGVTVADAGSQLLPPVALTGVDDSAAIAKVVAVLSDLAVARGLRALAAAHAAPSAGCDVSWGVVADGQPVAQPSAGTMVGLRDGVYVRIANRGTAPIYAHLFDVGLRGRVKRLTGDALGSCSCPASSIAAARSSAAVWSASASTAWTTCRAIARAPRKSTRSSLPGPSTSRSSRPSKPRICRWPIAAMSRRSRACAPSSATGAPATSAISPTTS